MAYDPARAALALLCVLVVAFAASLFPATGFGAYPTSGGGGGPVDGSLDSPDVTDSDAVDAGGGQSDSVTTTESPSSTPTETTESSDSETTTEAPDSGSGSDPGDGVDLTGLLEVGLLVLVGFVGFLLAPLGTVGGDISVAGVELPALQARLRTAVAAVPRRTMTFVVGLSASVPGLLDGLGRTLAQVGEALAVVASGVARTVASSVRLLTAGVGALFVTLPRAFGGGLSSLLGGLSRAGGSFRRGPRRDADDGTVGGDGLARSADDGGDTHLPRTVEDAWTAMVDLVPVRDRRSTTPGEYARAAVDAGLPAGPVQRLTALFEEVRYGDRSATADRVRSARAALRSILSRGNER